MKSERELIKRLLGIDIDDPAIRQRAWRRIRVFREIIAECEAEKNLHTATWLRGIVDRATGPQPNLICLAILAGQSPPDGRDEIR